MEAFCHAVISLSFNDKITGIRAPETRGHCHTAALTSDTDPSCPPGFWAQTQRCQPKSYEFAAEVCVGFLFDSIVSLRPDTILQATQTGSYPAGCRATFTFPSRSISFTFCLPCFHLHKSHCKPLSWWEAEHLDATPDMRIIHLTSLLRSCPPPALNPLRAFISATLITRCRHAFMALPSLFHITSPKRSAGMPPAFADKQVTPAPVLGKETPGEHTQRQSKASHNKADV